MFMLTLSKPGLKRLGALAVCGVMLAGAVVGANRWMQREPVAAGAPGPAVVSKIETTQDIGAYFAGRGFEVDLATATVDKVKIPRKWDDSFSAFNEVVRQSGADLTKYKGKTVEKWLALCPARSQGEQKAYAVLLVYKSKPVGAYLLARPGGEVTGLQSAAETALPLTEEELAAAAEFGTGIAPAEEAAAPEQAQQVSAAPEVPAEEAAAPEEAAPVAVEDVGAVPVE